MICILTGTSILQVLLLRTYSNVSLCFLCVRLSVFCGEKDVSETLKKLNVGIFLYLNQSFLLKAVMRKSLVEGDI